MYKGEIAMATLDDINRKIQQEKESYNRDLNRLQKEILDLKSIHQRNMADLSAQKENIKQYQQLEDYNKLIDLAMQE